MRRTLATLSTLGIISLASLTEGCMTAQKVYDPKTGETRTYTWVDGKKTLKNTARIASVAAPLLNGGYSYDKHGIAGPLSFAVKGGGLLKDLIEDAHEELPVIVYANPFEKQDPEGIRSDHLMGVTPFKLNVRASENYDQRGGYLWTLDDEPFSNENSGRTTISEPGEHTLKLIVTAQGEEPRVYAGSIRVLPRLKR
ncbi:MAG: hypothetical protein ABH864_04395 [archaeon]